MSARLVHVSLPDEFSSRLEEILAGSCRRFWRETVPGEQEKYSCIVQQRYTERLLKELDENFADVPTFTVYVARLEAVVPALEETAETEIPKGD